MFRAAPAALHLWQAWLIGPQRVPVAWLALLGESEWASGVEWSGGLWCVVCIELWVVLGLAEVWVSSRAAWMHVCMDAWMVWIMKMNAIHSVLYKYGTAWGLPRKLFVLLYELHNSVCICTCCVYPHPHPHPMHIRRQHGNYALPCALLLMEHTLSQSFTVTVYHRLSMNGAERHHDNESDEHQLHLDTLIRGGFWFTNLICTPLGA